MEREYYEQLGLEILAFDRRREHYRKKATEAAHARAKHFAEHKSGRAPKVIKRDFAIRTRVYPWNAVDIEELAHTRCVAPATMQARIFEAIASLWKSFPHDEFLYLKRVELPEDADGVIGVLPQPNAYLVKLGANESFNTRTFAKAVMHLLHEGVTEAALCGQIREVAVALRGLEIE